jgi:hypothetical protein
VLHLAADHAAVADDGWHIGYMELPHPEQGTIVARFNFSDRLPAPRTADGFGGRMSPPSRRSRATSII